MSNPYSNKAQSKAELFNHQCLVIFPFPPIPVKRQGQIPVQILLWVKGKVPFQGANILVMSTLWVVRGLFTAFPFTSLTLRLRVEAASRFIKHIIPHVLHLISYLALHNVFFSPVNHIKPGNDMPKLIYTVVLRRWMILNLWKTIAIKMEIYNWLAHNVRAHKLLCSLRMTIIVWAFMRASPGDNYLQILFTYPSSFQKTQHWMDIVPDQKFSGTVLSMTYFCTCSNYLILGINGNS